jgi:CRISPR/Cas system-associated endonuclease Cas3-HD
MKALQVLLNNDSTKHQPLQLFSQLTALRNQDNVRGVKVVESDSEDHDEYEDLEVIKDRLMKFKIDKAKEVAEKHVKTNVSIEDIVDKMKDELQYEALCIIKPTIKDSVERREKPVKDMGSTLPASLERNSVKDTPGFDFPSSKSRSKEMTIDLR